MILKQEENQIMKERHHKHPPLKKPVSGFYHKNEWAIYGTTCAQINELFHKINFGLKDLNIAYVDADHSESGSIFHTQIGKKNFTLTQTHEWNKYDDAIQCQFYDGVIVNGNHYPATRQIVVINANKRESLLRRVEQLTQIDAIVKPTGEEIFDFVQEKIGDETIILSDENPDVLFNFLRNSIKQNTAPLNALVLAGGKSLRMGRDKSAIIYHDKPQEIHVAEMCKELGMKTYISKQHGFKDDAINGFPVIKDRMEGMGPFGAILSAMMSDPDAAWCVLACDLPYLNKDSITKLVDERNASKFATAYKGASKDFPEPLITIYEPRSYHRFLSFLTLGYACPRKVLINSDIEIIHLLEERFIENINTPEEMDKIFSQINTNDE